MRTPIAAVALCFVGLSTEARAQERSTSEASTAEPTSVELVGSEPPDSKPPDSKPSASARKAREESSAKVAGATNHQQFIGDFAVGYLGLSQMAVANADGGFQYVAVPVIGGRYWLREGLGIDAGLGLVLASESATVEVDDVNTETDVPRPSAFLLHGGVPLVLADSRYFCFQLVPEMNIGFASTSQDVGGQEIDLSGFHLDLGGRLGAELHFGFVGLPQISLQAGVGMRMALERVSAENSETNDGARRSRQTLATLVGNDPWDIFAGSVSALLYLDR